MQQRHHEHLFKGLDTLDLSDCVEGAKVSLACGRKSKYADTDTLGLVYSSLMFNANRLNPGDIYVIKKGNSYEVLGGMVFELYLNGLALEKSGVTKANDIATTAGFAGGHIKTLKDDAGMGNVHLIWVDNETNIKKPHYHNRLSELYFVLSGRGTMHLKEATDHKKDPKTHYHEFSIEPGSFVAIPKGMIHNTIAKPNEQMLIQVVGLPHFYRDDMHFV